MNHSLKKYIYFIVFIIISFGYAIFQFYSIEQINVSTYGLFAPVMLFGSLVAGSTPMGGGVIAFPAMSYALTDLVTIASTYSLAIQSFGMTAASLLLIAKEKENIDFSILKFSIPLSLITILIAKSLTFSLSMLYAKIIFSSFWFGCGIILFWLHEKLKSNKEIKKRNHFLDKSLLFFVIIMGSIISGLIGSGADFLIFIFLVLRFDESLKKATFTSVIHMACVSTIYTVYHYFSVTEVIKVEVIKYLTFSIPIVVIFAPIGSWVLSNLRESTLRKWIYLIILVQYISALLILNLEFIQFLLSLGIVLLTIASAHLFRNVGIKRA